MPEISVIQFGVMPALIQQSIVTALLNDRSFLHDNDTIRGFDRGQAMRDQNAGGVFENEIQRLLNLPFGKWINAGGGFIKDEDGGVLHKHAHERHELALSH